MRVNSNLRQAIHRWPLGEHVDERREIVLGPSLSIALAPVGRDECPQNAPRLRRPGHIGLVDVPAPGGGVIAAGWKTEDDREHQSSLPLLPAPDSASSCSRLLLRAREIAYLAIVTLRPARLSFLGARASECVSASLLIASVVSSANWSGFLRAS